MSGGIGRASVLIGAGTVVSRLTGFFRNAVLVAAIGSLTNSANAFAVANQLPNNIYAIISSGLLTAIVVPQIVKAARHEDGGSAFISKLFTLGTVTLLVVTALATAAAPWLVQFYAPYYSSETQALATAFAYWCLPQILFYGLYAMVGEALNARGMYGPYTWAPIVNNIVSIAGFLAFIAFFGTSPTEFEWTPAMIATVAGTATAGIVVQAGILFLFWRRTGIPLRPDFRWRGVGLNQIARLAGWTFLMVMAGQIAGAVQSRVLSSIPSGDPGVAISGYMWLLFMLPYSIIVISIGTPYFTRLSGHAEAGRDDLVRTDLAQSIRTLGLFVVIATVALMVASGPAARIFTTSAAGAGEASLVLVMYLISLIPMSVLYVVLRGYFAYHDTKTPFFFTLAQAGVVILTALLALILLPKEHLLAGVAAGQSLASIVQVVLAALWLHRRIGGFDVAGWVRSLVRFAVATVPAAAVGWGVYLWTGSAAGWMLSGQIMGALGTGLICVVMFIIYLGTLVLLRSPEVSGALGLIRRFLPGR